MTLYRICIGSKTAYTESKQTAEYVCECAETLFDDYDFDSDICERIEDMADGHYLVWSTREAFERWGKGNVAVAKEMIAL